MPEFAGSDTKPQVIDIKALRFNYGANPVINLEQFQLAVGESLAIIGASGCGKTTLLHLLAGLLKPTDGCIRILSNDITNMSESQLDRFRGEHIGMVFQRLFLMPALSVRQNVELAQQLARKPRDDAWIEALLQRLDVAEVAHSKPRTLSQGQAQRVAIARALVHRPALVLADEPTSALDDEHAQQALALLKEATAALGTSLLLVTHDARVRGQLDHEFNMGLLP